MLKSVIVNEDENDQINEITKIIHENVVTIYVNSFSEESAKSFYEDFNKALKTKQNIIPVIIDSYGGAVDALASMMDLLDSSPVPVATICLAKAMSCGSVLLSCGDEGMRFIAPSARVMIHHVSSATWEKVPQMKIDVEEAERMQHLMFGKMAKNCGKREDYFLKQLKNRGNVDWYLTPEECLQHNLVNHIKIPHLKTSVVIRSDFV